MPTIYALQKKIKSFIEEVLPDLCKKVIANVDISHVPAKLEISVILYAITYIIIYSSW